MKTPIKSTKSGFTLIEIVIVLAIAAVIIGLVFLIVPNAQRSARDTKIQSNSNALSASMESYIAGNGGTVSVDLTKLNLPAGCGTATTNGVTCNALTVTRSDGGTAKITATGTINIASGASCNTDGSSTTAAGRYAVQWYSESAAASKCVGN